MRVALYLRVSTDGQTTENQKLILEGWANHAGHEIVAVYIDHGISGAKGRDKRPQFNALHKAIARREFDMVAAWSVDRLGRSLQDLVKFLDEMRASGIELFLHQQGLDTSTPAGRAMFQMLGVFSEFERSMIADRVKAGLQRARAAGKRLGRRPVDRLTSDRIRSLREQGGSIRRIAAEIGCSPNTVQKILNTTQPVP